MDSISLDAAEVMTGISRRTLWRRVADGMLTSADKDSRGRTTVVLDTALLGLLRDALGLDWSGQDAQDLALADAGNVQAQLNVGTRLYAATTPRTAPPPPPYMNKRALRPCIGCNWPPSRAMPMPCTGWAWRQRRRVRLPVTTRPWRGWHRPLPTAMRLPSSKCRHWCSGPWASRGRKYVTGAAACPNQSGRA